MAVELPEPLQWVLMLLAGTRWPEADEDALREMADRWRKTAKSVEDAGHAADNAVKQALDGQQGSAAESLNTFWAQYTVGKGTADQPGYFPGLVDSCNSMGDMLEEMANSAETAKIQIIASLAILAFDIATAEAEAPETLGISLAQIPIAIAAGRAAVQALLKAFLKEVVTMAAKQAAQMAAINLMAQGIEVAQGHRKSIDFKEVGQAAEGGAVAGAAGHLIGKGVGEGGAALGLRGAMGTVPGKMATGAAVGVATDATTQAITTGHVDGSTLLGSGLGGAGAAGAHAAAGAFRGHSGPPSPEIPHHDLPPGQTHLDSTGNPVFTKSGNPNLGDDAGAGLDGTGSGSGSTFRGVKDTSSQDDGGTAPHGLSPFTLDRDTTSPTGSGADRSGSNEPIGSTGSTGSTGGRTTGSSRVEPEAEPQPAAPVQLNADRSPTPTDLPAENRSAVHEPEPVAPTVETPREAPAPTPVETTQIRPEARTPVESTQIRPEAPTPVESTQIRTDAPAPEEAVRPTPTVETPREAPAPTPVETTQIRTDAPTPVETNQIRPEAPTPVETTQIRTDAPTPVETTQIRPEAPAPVEMTQIRTEAPAPVEMTQIRTDAPAPVETTPIRTEAPTRVEAPAFQSSDVPHPVLSGVHLDDTSMPAPVHSAVAVDPSSMRFGDHVPSPSAAPASSHGGGDHEAQQQPVMAGAPPVSVPAGAGAGGGGRAEGPAFATPTPTPVPRHDTSDVAPPPPAPGAPRPTTSLGGLRPAPERPAGPRPDSDRPAPPPGTSSGTGTGRSAGGGTRQANTKPVDNRPPVLTSHTKWMAEGHSRDVFRTTDIDHATELVDKLPGMTPADRAKAIGSLDANGRHWLARNPELVDRLRDELPPDEFARTAAHFMVNVDPRSEQPVSAREAAQAQVARMLQDPHVAAELLKRGAAVTVVPKGVKMTDVPAFQRLAGAQAGGASGGGRGWDTIRGSGGLHTAFAEENLLGGHTTVPGAGDYADGYSTSTHEFAHNIHQYGLSPDDRRTITEAYQGKINTDDMTRMFGEETPITWSDGARNLHDTDNDNYASRDELEYFAQVSNAYLGTNHGTDLYTGEARNNGPEWVKENEPDLLPLMERLYGKDPQAIHPEPANPVNAVQEDHDLHEAVRNLLGDGTLPPAPVGHAPVPPQHQPPAVPGQHVPPQRQAPAVPGQHVPPAAPTQHHEPAPTVLEHHDPTTVQEQHHPAGTGADHQQPEATVPLQHEPPAVPGQHVPPAAPTQHHEPATTVLEHHDPTTVQEQHQPAGTGAEQHQPAGTGADHQQPEATVPLQHEPPLAPPPPPLPKQQEPAARPGSSVRHDPPPAPPVAPLKRDGSDVSMGSGSERESDDDASMGRVSDTSMGRDSDASMGRHSETESESDSDESMRSGSQDSRTGPPRPPVEQRRPLPVGVHLDVPEGRTDKLAGHEVKVSEISISADRPMTRYGGKQRSHTVPWTLTRRAVGGLAGRNAHELWTELKTEVKELREYKPRGTGAEAKDAAKVATRWDDILDRLDRLPDTPPHDQQLHEWHEQLGDLLSGYVELSQLTSFASFADGRAVGRGEHSTMKGLDQAEQNAAKKPKPQEDEGTGDESDEEPVGENTIGDVVRNKLLDLKENKSLTPEDVVAAKRHLARGLLRSFPKLMEGKEGPAILKELGFDKTNPPPETYGSGKLPKQGFLADVSVKPGGADGPRVGRIMLSEKDRPPTQFGGGGQLSHTGSWSLLRGTLLSFEGRGTRELGNWLGDRFSGMETVVRDMPGHADDLKAIKEAQKQLGTLDSASDHEASRKLGGLLETFVTVHQKMPFASFPDHLQGGTASSSGEIDLPVTKGGHDGAPVGPRALASHFDGAAPFGMGLKDLAHSYQDWKAHAEVLGPVDQEAINQLAGRTFTPKNLEGLKASSAAKTALGAEQYLKGLGNWDRGMSLAFGKEGEQAVKGAWAEHRGEFGLKALGTFSAPPDHITQLGKWLGAVTSADRPTDRPQELAALTRYYHGLVNAPSTRSQAKAAELEAFAEAEKTFKETPATTPPSHDEISLRLGTAMLGNTIPRDGDCLYHAVGVALTGAPPSHHAALDLRSRVTDWVLQDGNLETVRQHATQYGVGMDDLIETLSTSGNWAGNAGDLAPQIVATALGASIRVHLPDGTEHLLAPLTVQPGPTRIIELDLEDGHYEVHGPGLGGKRQDWEESEDESSGDEGDIGSSDDSDGEIVQAQKKFKP
ncbi:hypothetical protein OG500_32675 [Kitasatospora sp. NBC_01250]|uniref:WXG100-like domain-containing protein n=1 Tax=Kitasatospora sp. NBC_01250 TaxID=2903571 RepID=UPI002E37EDC0|nr:hypothetical protein [Kitasatospora sp. NBC_01250]